ncbi:MAG: threonine ammonia-lyase [Moraxellaceae bacterium]|nr:threonine ammonia-lyase [Pseudobdellovibrionaceae bacterium]
MKVTLQDIQNARQNIADSINLTVCDYSRSATALVGCEVFFKLENTQRTGSFKIRGATNKILSLTEAEKKCGVIACSAGNHAQGVALSSKIHGVQSTIVMPINAPLSKVEATKNYGATVILYGTSFDEAKDYSIQLAKEKGYIFVHPYEDEKVIAGQGTIGLEVLEQIPDLTSIVVPVGGGGLISGIAIAAKSINPKIKIIGAQTETVSTMSQLFHQHKFEMIQNPISTLADGIAIKKPSQIMYDDFISKYVDEIVTVTEGQIAEAMVFLLERVKTVAEGSGAVGLAAILSHKNLKLGSKTCVLVCGGNVDLNMISGVIQHGQIQRGRLCELSVIVPDIPGSLSRLTQILADNRANILEVHHDRIGSDLGMKQTKIDFVIETIDHEHIEVIRKAIQKTGAQV